MSKKQLDADGTPVADEYPCEQDRMIIIKCLSYMTNLNQRKAWDFWTSLEPDKRDAVVSMLLLTNDVDERASIAYSLSKGKWPPEIKRRKKGRPLRVRGPK